MADLKVLELKAQKYPPTEKMLDGLASLFSQAKEGQVKGVVIFADLGNGYSHYTLGETDLGTLVLAIEAWKFNQMAQSELICPQCGYDETDEH